MSKYCSKECEEVGPVCDFCIYYNFNANKNGAYTGHGYCKKLKIHREPYEGCNEFVCQWVSGYYTE